jgi:CHAD domain-containing protein
MAKARHIPGLTSATDVSEAIRAVLTTRFDEMHDLRDTALDWQDPEGVHDMRVASRRLRSAMGDFAPCMRERPLSDVLQRIKQVARALGSVREDDVAIIALNKAAAKAPEQIASGIPQFADERRRHLDESRALLEGTLKQDEWEQLTVQFRSGLDAALALPRTRKKAAAHCSSYGAVGAFIIDQRLEGLEKLGKSLYHPLRIKRLHQLRLAAKHLRYALELFEQCWGDQAGFFAAKASGLQSSLGELHDCDIWLGTLGKSEFRSVEHFPRQTLTWLINYFLRLRTKNFAKALKQMQEWETNDFSAQIRAMLVPAVQKQVVVPAVQEQASPEIPEETIAQETAQ